ncbi:MAG: addiction module protein [Panacagrimonas sp.]
MGRSVVQLFDQAVEMSEGDRAALAGLLLESIEGPADPDVEAAWAREIERRVKELDEGRAKLIPWEQVKAELIAAEHAEKP